MNLIRKFINYSMLLGALNTISCNKENPANSNPEYGIIEGIVRIDPSPYQIGTFSSSTPGVSVQLLGESGTMGLLRGSSEFDKVGNTNIYEANFKLGNYDGNNEWYTSEAFRGVIPGFYSIKFYDGFFDKSFGGRVELEEKIVSTIGDTPIEVRAGRTTHIGVITLIPE